MIADPPTPAAGSRTGLSVAFCPATPLLLPAVAGRAAEGTGALRSACAAAVAGALTVGPEVVVVVGAVDAGVVDAGAVDAGAAAGGGRSGGVRYGAGDGGTLRGFGVDVDVPFEGRIRPGGRRLPLAHTLGAWLLDEAGWPGTRLGVTPGDLADALAGPPAAVTVLAMGDGSARRSVKAPGHLDAAAGPFDGRVADALRTGDAAALAALDPVEGGRLLAAGVPTWRAVGAALAGRAVEARLHYDDAPYGVGYLVAEWSAS